MPTPCPPNGLLVIGEAPGAEEDEIGEGFVGQAGRTLDALLVQHGFERNRDYGVANIVRCRPEKNRKPSRQEINACLPWLAEFLVYCKPKVLLLVGSTANDVFLGKRSLMQHIERQGKSPVILVRDAHSCCLQDAIRSLHYWVVGLYAVPMPHTSGMAWNRKAPDGRLWREIGAEQIALATDIVKRHAN